MDDDAFVRHVGDCLAGLPGVEAVTLGACPIRRPCGNGRRGLVGTGRGGAWLRAGLPRRGRAADPVRRARGTGRVVPKPGQENLFLRFPGLNHDSGFLAELVHADAKSQEPHL